MIFQEPMTALNPTMTVGDQIAEVLTNHTDLTKRQARARAVEMLERVGIPEAALRAKGYPHELSGGQRQRVVIAIALANQPKLIIADEPTTALDVTVQAEILDLIRTLAHESSTAFLLITHNMGVVADIADTVAVMYRGDIVEVGDMRRVLLDPQADYSRQLIDAIPKLPAAHWDVIEAEAQGQGAAVGDDAAGLSVRPTHDADAEGVAGAEAALSFDHVSIDYRRGGKVVRAVKDVTLSISKAEIVGLVGESGSGKSTLARAALGLIPVAEGEIRLLGQPVNQRMVLSAADKSVRGKVGMIFQDPGSSLDPRKTIAESIEEPLIIHRSAHGKTRASRRAWVNELMDAVELPSDYAQRFPHELSGGQRQRVGLARAIALDPALLIADEPTSALDVSVQAHVLDAIRALQARYQFACLFISHDLAVVHSMASRVAVMWHGEIVETGTGEEVLTRPRHAYSQRLLAAVPSPDPHEQERRREARRTLEEVAALSDGLAL
jgi:peptide/nickel transport system ATP-binding protein